MTNRCPALRYGGGVLLFALALLLAPAGVQADVALLNKGEQQIAANKFKSAIASLKRALNSSDLSDEQIAKTLLLRGIAYNGAKGYGSAIADLTGALALGKLSPADQKRAYAERAKAYKETGYGKLASQDLGRAGGVRAVSGENAASAARAKRVRSGGVSSGPPAATGVPAFQTTVSPSSAEAPAPPARPARKPAVKQVKKPAAIPAFRTSVTAE